MAKMELKGKLYLFRRNISFQNILLCLFYVIILMTFVKRVLLFICNNVHYILQHLIYLLTIYIHDFYLQKCACKILLIKGTPVAIKTKLKNKRRFFAIFCFLTKLCQLAMYWEKSRLLQRHLAGYITFVQTLQG